LYFLFVKKSRFYIFAYLKNGNRKYDNLKKMKISTKPNLVFGEKRVYRPPILFKIGNISNLTLKTGSQSDFGGNKYTP
jgi:hypothetical protein